MSSVILILAVIQNISVEFLEGKAKPSPNLITQELRQDQFHRFTKKSRPEVILSLIVSLSDTSQCAPEEHYLQMIN